MSTIISTSGGGFDFASLTSGERFLLGWLGNWILGSVSGGGYPVSRVGMRQSGNDQVGTLDFSNVNSITLERGYAVSSGSTAMYNGSLRDHDAVATASWGSSFSARLSFAGVAASSKMQVYIESNYDVTGNGISCSSFTTADGKVHTLADINY